MKKRTACPHNFDDSGSATDNGSCGLLPEAAGGGSKADGCTNYGAGGNGNAGACGNPVGYRHGIYPVKHRRACGLLSG